MKKKCIQHWLQEQKHNHPNRRELIEDTAKAFAGYLFAPTILGLFAKENNALAEAQLRGSLTEFYFQGGPTFHMDAMMVGRTVTDLGTAAYQTHGRTATTSTTEFGAPMWNSPFMTQFLATLNPTMRSKIQMMSFSGIVNDDVGASTYRIGPQLSALMNRVQRLAIPGFTNGVSNSNVLGTNPATAAVQLNSNDPVSAFQALLNIQGPLGGLTPAMKAQLSQFNSRLSQKAMNDIMRMPAANVEKMVAQGNKSFADAQARLASVITPPDPRTDAAVSGVYGTAPTGFELMLATIALGLNRGDSKVASITAQPAFFNESTFDYHDGNAHDHGRIGAAVAKYMNALFAGGQDNFAVRLHCDGAASFRNQNGTLVASGDSGTRASHLLISFNGAGRRLTTPVRGYGRPDGQVDAASWAGANNEVVFAEAQLATVADQFGLDASSVISAAGLAASGYKS